MFFSGLSKKDLPAKIQKLKQKQVSFKTWEKFIETSVDIFFTKDEDGFSNTELTIIDFCYKLEDASIATEFQRFIPKSFIRKLFYKTNGTDFEGKVLDYETAKEIIKLYKKHCEPVDYAIIFDLTKKNLIPERNPIVSFKSMFQFHYERFRLLRQLEQGICGKSYPAQQLIQLYINLFKKHCKNIFDFQDYTSLIKKIENLDPIVANVIIICFIQEFKFEDSVNKDNFLKILDLFEKVELKEECGNEAAKLIAEKLSEFIYFSKNEVKFTNLTLDELEKQSQDRFLLEKIYKILQFASDKEAFFLVEEILLDRIISPEVDFKQINSKIKEKKINCWRIWLVDYIFLDKVSFEEALDLFIDYKPFLTGAKRVKKQIIPGILEALLAKTENLWQMNSLEIFLLAQKLTHLNGINAAKQYTRKLFLIVFEIIQKKLKEENKLYLLKEFPKPFCTIFSFIHDTKKLSKNLSRKNNKFLILDIESSSIKDYLENYCNFIKKLQEEI